MSYVSPLHRLQTQAYSKAVFYGVLLRVFYAQSLRLAQRRRPCFPRALAAASGRGATTAAVAGGRCWSAENVPSFGAKGSGTWNDIPN